MRKLLQILCLVILAIVALNMLHTSPSTASHAAAVLSTQSHTTAEAKTLVPVHVVVRLNQLDCHQYTSLQECSTWSPSACSAASMTEVINTFGHSYRITDVLRVEAAFKNPTVITPDDGLLYLGGLDRTLRAFGFQTRTLQNLTVAQLVAATVTAPIIINFPPSRWAGGHFLVAIGGDATHVYLADSSRFDMRSMSTTTFLKYWVGFAVQVTAKQGGQQ